MVIWLIGMSASGKTTIGKKIYSKLSTAKGKWIFLDGDTFRNILGEDLGHGIEDRKVNAYRISRFCEFLSSQNINVIACVLSIFHDNQEYNRKNISNYKEVYIKVSMDNLIKRDNKQIYKKALDGEMKNVVGVDIEFKPPYSPDIIIDNDKEDNDFEEDIEKIIEKFNIELTNEYIYTQKSLLKNPEKYQYSQFEGNSFFGKFIKDRENSIKMLKNRQKKFLEYNYSYEDNYYCENYIEGNDIVLSKYLIYLLKGDKLEFEKVNLLIKRFEVSKKLYTTYNKRDIKKSSNKYNEILNYSLFSLVLQKLYHNSLDDKQKMIYLNIILKLHDTLSSIKEDIILPLEIDYALKAFEGEMVIVKDYLC